MSSTLLSVAVEILAERDRVRVGGSAADGFAAVVHRMLPVIWSGDPGFAWRFGGPRREVTASAGQVGPVFDLRAAGPDGQALHGGGRALVKTIESAGTGGPCKIVYEFFAPGSAAGASAVSRGVIRAARPAEAVEALKDAVAAAAAGLAPASAGMEEEHGGPRAPPPDDGFTQPGLFSFR